MEFTVGVVLFVIGSAIVIFARSKEANAIAGDADPFFKWFLEVLKEFFSTLTSPSASTWQRLAAVGSDIGRTRHARCGSWVSRVGRRENPDGFSR